VQQAVAEKRLSLHPDDTPPSLGSEYQQTEAMLAESGVPYVVLVNRINWQRIFELTSQF
jgi:uncharacterized protein YbjT (DUF2867 family)